MQPLVRGATPASASSRSRVSQSNYVNTARAPPLTPHFVPRGRTFPLCNTSYNTGLQSHWRLQQASWGGRRFIPIGLYAVPKSTTVTASTPGNLSALNGATLSHYGQPPPGGFPIPSSVLAWLLNFLKLSHQQHPPPAFSNAPPPPPFNKASHSECKAQCAVQCGYLGISPY